MRIAALLPLALVSLAVQAGSLSHPDQVDRIELDANTSQAMLLVLLDEDRVDSRPAARALFSKVNRYLDFINSGQFKGTVPAASSAMRPKILVYAPRDATPAEMQNLAGLQLAGRKSGVEVEVMSYRAGITPRPIPIQPYRRSGAGPLRP